jgi:Family of unknown function (DUF5313)
VTGVAVTRPNVFQWIWFAFGGRLPMRFREWVLQDAVSRTWLLRFSARAVVRIAPLVIAALIVLRLVDAQLAIAVAAVVLGLTVGLYYALSYAPERVDQQLVSYGYPPGTAERTREERSGAKTQRERERYERTWRPPPDS